MSIWDAPIGFANSVYTWAYVALILGAIITAISTMSLFWASGVRDKFADLQITAAQDDAAHAIERTKDLELQTAQAVKEQTRLQIELEKEQVGRLKFEAQFAWRVIDDPQKQILINTLATLPGTVNISFLNSDPESTFFASQLSNIFSSARWHVNMSAGVYPGSVILGVFIAGSPGTNDETQIVESAFSTIGLSFSNQAVAPPPMSFGTLLPNAVNIVVGGKPIPDVLSAIQSSGAH